VRLTVAFLLAACTHQGHGPGTTTAVDAPPPGSWQAPLGAHWSPDGSAVVFRVASTRATRVELDVFAQDGAAAQRTVVMTQDSPTTWMARVAAADLPPTIYYGYRVWGPNWPYDPAWQPGSQTGWITDVDASGNRMNPNKLVFDPYAVELSHDPLTPDFADGSVYAVGSHRGVDSAPYAPKGIVLHDDAPDIGVKPVRPLGGEIVYEVHVRGFTAALPITCAGTYAGAATKAAYLADLGVTAIELMPLAETPNDRNDVDPQSDSGDNYWGYSTLAYFAPDRRYACDRTPGGPTRELRAMVKAFHAAGIKVYVDVVYNHTAEGAGSSLLSLRGLDNAGYYQLDRAGTGFSNNNGVGADVAAQKPLASALVLDSLRYWRDSLGFDGFRFDLAPVLGNTCGPGCFTFDPTSLPLQIAQQIGSSADLIAEPWAVTAGGYSVGKFPPPWAEWNDKFRDAVRQDQNQVGSLTPGWLSDRIAGSPEVYMHDGRTPAAGVSYLVSHDGFTLHDLYACNAPNNAQLWPYGPSSGGTTNNYSWDHGGDATAQRQATRTGLALMMLSSGVPMMTGGDELARSVRCNNNPYNLDSAGTWLDWSTQGDALWTFTRRLLRFRAAHPELHRPDFTTPIAWFDVTGQPAAGTYMNDASRPMLGWRVNDVYVMYNRSTAKVTITLPPAGTGKSWFRVANTAAFLEAQSNMVDPGSEQAVTTPTYDLDARALAILIAR
jgi:glycogen operon protein